jgi:hypothetical protein
LVREGIKNGLTPEEIYDMLADRYGTPPVGDYDEDSDVSEDPRILSARESQREPCSKKRKRKTKPKKKKKLNVQVLEI